MPTLPWDIELKTRRKQARATPSQKKNKKKSSSFTKETVCFSEYFDLIPTLSGALKEHQKLSAETNFRSSISDSFRENALPNQNVFYSSPNAHFPMKCLLLCVNAESL